MSSRLIVMIIALPLVTLAATAAAQPPPLAANCTATLNAPVPAVSVFTVPNGSGRPLSNCFAFGGTSVSASIDVWLRNAAGNAAFGVPQTDVRLNIGQLVWCSNAFYPPPPWAPNCADFQANLAGFTQFTMSYHGGGWTNAGTVVWVDQGGGNWGPIPNPVQVHFNSADMNGDLAVNLIDIGMFSAIFFGTYSYAADFVWDGVINLSDIGILAQSVGIICP